MAAALAAYLHEAGWTDLGLVLEVETVVRWPAHPTCSRQEQRYFLTSLPPTTTAATALQAARRH